MSVKTIIVFFYLLLSSVSLAMASSQDQSTSPVPKKSQPTGGSQPQHADEGERIFHQNCSRCHNTPEGFQPSVSGTVARHMRVRASLSKEDEKQLLRFLNP